VDPRILELCRQSPRYAYEAYEFVCEAVTFTQQLLGRCGPDDDLEVDHHVSGAELLHGVCELALREFGMMASVVFRQWGIHTTDDIGTIVFNLIAVGRLNKSDRDSPEDFHDLFDLHKVLTKNFTILLEQPHSLRRSER
jgi:uncharacterized repeat protein (TIGR04138 family)